MLIGLPSRRELMQPFALTTRIQEPSRGQALRACTRILTRPQMPTFWLAEGEVVHPVQAR
jgi:hypothetical protein